MNRREIKAKAKEMTRGNKWNIWKPTLVYALIIIISSMIISAIFSSESISYSLASLIVSIALIPVTYGITAYNLNLVRGKKFSLNNLTEYYSIFGRLFLISLLTGLFTFLWSLLFIIPGIIAAYAYSMVSFIAIDNPELNGSAALKKSKELMKGHKWEYFVFALSFLGWDILSVFTLGLLNIWLLPYETIATVLFYENLHSASDNA